MNDLRSYSHTLVLRQQDFAAAAARLGVAVTRDEPLARHTTFRIGGPADLYVAASTTEQLTRLAELALELGIPATVLGGGSNVLVSDAGVRGLVIANQTREFGIGEQGAETDGVVPPPRPPAQRLSADSGVLLAGLARWAIKNGLSGLEWAVSVPGTVGGAVIGNAGAHGSDIAASLAWARVADPARGQRLLTAARLEYGYRTSALKQRVGPQEVRAGPAGCPVVLAAGFDLIPGEVAGLAARADAFLARRRATQPVEPSAGSVFRNPPGDHAGRLIEAVGLKGHRVGGAQVSPQHANFIINAGGASAADVVALMALARQRVHESFGITLVPEILFLGAWDGPLWNL